MGILTRLAGRLIRDENFDGKGYADLITGLKWVLSLVPLHVANAYSGTSQSTVTIGTGPKIFVFTNANGQIPSFKPGTVVKLSDAGDPASNYMVGTLTDYDEESGNAQVAVDDIGGAGTFSAWTVVITGRKGPAAGAPDTAPFVTVGHDSGLDNERAARGRRGVRLVDGGANQYLDFEYDSPITAVSAASYEVTEADRGNCLRFTNPAGCAVALPPASGSYSNGFVFDYIAPEAASVVFTPASGTIRGASSHTARASSAGRIIADGTNWQAQVDVGSASLAANTFTGRQTLPASVAGGATLNMPHGVAPSTPVNGDIWTSTVGLFLRFAGATKRLLTTDDLPSGSLVDFAGISVPAGYLACNGAAVSRTTYAALFAAIGTSWGAGDGSTTFNVPDFRRRVAVGSGGTAIGTLGNAVGNTGGAETHALTAAENGPHGHGVNDPGHLHGNVWGQYDPAANWSASGGNGMSAISNTAAAATGISIQASGSGTPHNTMQPSAVVLKIIKI